MQQSYPSATSPHPRARSRPTPKTAPAGPRARALFRHVLQSGLYSETLLSIPVNKFWLMPDSWLKKARQAGPRFSNTSRKGRSR